ncbi:MAG: hypothetical protein ACYSVY_12230 [Planctomycetota bacterium]|jgi:hypothetical protein
MQRARQQPKHIPVDQGLGRIGHVDRDPSPCIGSVLGIDEHGRAIQMRRVRLDTPGAPVQSADGQALPAGTPFTQGAKGAQALSRQSVWHKARQFLKVVTGPKVGDDAGP